jgi:hypothetical protein
MGVTMSLKGLSDLGQGRWEYRRRVPASAKEALGKSEWKRVIRARSDADLLRQYALVVADFEREVAAATKPKRAMTPREAWEAALREADGLTLGALGLEPEEAREVVAETLAVAGEKPLTVQALMDPDRAPPGFTVEDARRVYVEERLGGGEGPEHRGTMVRLDRVMRLAEEAGLSASTFLGSTTREHARKVRDHMMARQKNGGEGRVSPASVKRELGLLRSVLSYGARELGLLDWSNPFDRLPIEGLSAASGARVADREKVDPLPPTRLAGMPASSQASSTAAGSMVSRLWT